MPASNPKPPLAGTPLVSPREGELLEAIREHPTATQRKLGDVMGCSRTLINKMIKRLIKIGVVRHIFEVTGEYHVCDLRKKPKKMLTVQNEFGYIRQVPR